MNYKDIYTDVFSNDPTYNYDESGWIKAGMAVQYALDRKLKHIIDIGAGRGRFVKLMKKANPLARVWAYDLDKFGDYPSDVFRKFDLSNQDQLWNLPNVKHDLIVCTGVLEHVEEHLLDEILEVFHMTAPRAFISIGNHDEVIRGHTLHLTNRNAPYWWNKFAPYYEIERAIENFYEDTLYIYELNSKYGNPKIES
jgi:hypothetical protein